MTPNSSTEIHIEHLSLPLFIFVESIKLEPPTVGQSFAGSWQFCWVASRWQSCVVLIDTELKNLYVRTWFSNQCIDISGMLWANTTFKVSCHWFIYKYELNFLQGNLLLEQHWFWPVNVPKSLQPAPNCPHLSCLGKEITSMTKIYKHMIIFIALFNKVRNTRHSETTTATGQMVLHITYKMARTDI